MSTSNKQVAEVAAGSGNTIRARSVVIQQRESGLAVTGHRAEQCHRGTRSRRGSVNPDEWSFSEGRHNRVRRLGVCFTASGSTDDVTSVSDSLSSGNRNLSFINHGLLTFNYWRKWQTVNSVGWRFDRSYLQPIPKPKSAIVRHVPRRRTRLGAGCAARRADVGDEALIRSVCRVVGRMTQQSPPSKLVRGNPRAIREGTSHLSP